MSEDFSLQFLFSFNFRFIYDYFVFKLSLMYKLHSCDVLFLFHHPLSQADKDQHGTSSFKLQMQL